MFGVITDIWAQTVIATTVSCYPPDIKYCFVFTICDFEKRRNFFLNVQFLTFEIPINKSKVAELTTVI